MNTLQGIANHPHFGIYVIYSLVFVLLGSLMIGLGPFVPYLAQSESRLETQYSLIFMARGIGFTLGSASVKFIEKYLTFHQALAMGCVGAGLFSIIFNLTQSLAIHFTFIALTGFCFSYLDVFVNICTLEAFRKTNLDIWLQFLHGCFGIGGLIGPYLIYLFEFQAFNILGILIILLGFVIIRKPTPQSKNEQSLIKEQQSQRYAPGIIILFICFSFLFIVGQQNVYGSWISSYAVLNGFSTKQHATMYSSVYWISITFFRFALPFVPGQPTKKIIILTVTAIIQSFISLIIISDQNAQFGMILSSIVFGFSNSSLFPLLLSIPNQFGMKISPSDNSYFLMFASLGEVIGSPLVGYSMQLISYGMLFVAMLIFNALALLNTFKIVNLCKQQTEKSSNNKSNEIEL